MCQFISVTVISSALIHVFCSGTQKYIFTESPISQDHIYNLTETDLETWNSFKLKITLKNIRVLHNGDISGFREDSVKMSSEMLRHVVF